MSDFRNTNVDIQLGTDMTVNAVKCLACGVILESKSRHDFQQCDCDNQTFVDGGRDYRRYGGVDMSKVAVLGVL